MSPNREFALRATPSRYSQLWLAGAALFVILSGCGVGEVDVDSNAAPTFEEFEASVYKEPWADGVYIVNGDTAISNEKKLREFHAALYGSTGALIVHREGNVDATWNATERKALTYCVSNAFGANKAKVVQAMAEATAAWQAAADVKYSYVAAQDAACTANNANVVFDVGQVTGQPYLARAFFPREARAARNVLIDTSSFGNLGAITLVGILRHELGHTLGFRHEHTRPEAGTCFEDNSWRPLTPYDSASVMHYPQCKGTGVDLSLTVVDIQGAKGLYGAPVQNPTPQPPPPATGTPKTESATGTLARGGQDTYTGIPVVPGSRFIAKLSGQGDADLYVRFNAAPTLAQFDCRPYLDGSAELCALDVPATATTAHMMIHGYTAASYTIEATWVEP